MTPTVESRMCLLCGSTADADAPRCPQCGARFLRKISARKPPAEDSGRSALVDPGPPKLSALDRPRPPEDSLTLFFPKRKPRHITFRFPHWEPEKPVAVRPESARRAPLAMRLAMMSALGLLAAAAAWFLRIQSAG